MRTLRHCVPLIIALLLFAGCASLGPPFEPVSEMQPGKALVYIYRPGAFVGSGVSYTVHAGETPIAKLQSGSYYPYFSDPGEVEFWAKTEAKSSVTKQLKAGEVYYLKGGVGVGFFVGHPKLSFVSEAEALSEIHDTKLIPTD